MQCGAGEYNLAGDDPTGANTACVYIDYVTTDHNVAMSAELCQHFATSEDLSFIECTFCTGLPRGCSEYQSDNGGDSIIVYNPNLVANGINCNGQAALSMFDLGSTIGCVQFVST